MLKYLHKYEIPLTQLKKSERVSNSKRLNLDKNLLSKLYTEGGSCNYIAKKLNRSPTTIKKYLIQYGIIS